MGKRTVEIFDQDVLIHGGYQYTTTSRVSTQFVLRRSLDVILQTNRFADRSVLDIGCGDGFFTIQLWDRGGCRSIVGIDAVPGAIETAIANSKDRAVKFMVGDVQKLPFPDNSFDLVLAQSVLHHVDNPLETMREAFRVAPEVLILESNGNNLAVKIITKTSRYHRQHKEKAFSTYKLTNWVKQCGGQVVHKKFVNFVPIFCPDWLAKMMKSIEPLVESLYVLSSLSCSICLLSAERCK